MRMIVRMMMGLEDGCVEGEEEGHRAGPQAAPATFLVPVMQSGCFAPPTSKRDQGRHAGGEQHQRGGLRCHDTLDVDLGQ